MDDLCHKTRTIPSSQHIDNISGVQSATACPSPQAEDRHHCCVVHAPPDVLDGYNSTVFAYGQTGSGKTFTMMGADIDSDKLKGIIPRITEQIFQSIVESDATWSTSAHNQPVWLYLTLFPAQNDNLQVHEEKTKGVKGLSDYYVSSAREVYEIMRTGGNARMVSSTNMNTESSCSHSIFLISINQRNTESGAQKTGNLYLVDLAGSEKVGKTGASGQTLEEVKKINKNTVKRATKLRKEFTPITFRKRDAQLRIILSEYRMLLKK
ncbi:P-loop containing nucleoside triphosphate hydrolase protein [Mycena leptocephala]|nr:P-loop containing nucleoside triphosphate hydrolase protein [Mycena leptocephala]